MAILKQTAMAIALVALVGGSAIAQVYTDAAPRKLAPGVIVTIKDADIDDATLDRTRAFTELISVVKPAEWTPNFDPTTETILEKAKRVGFQREVWTLEFGFKPLRVINVNGKDVWYLIYFVRNNGEVRSPAVTDTQTIEIRGQKKPVRFVPSFLLQAHDLDRAYKAGNRSDVINQIAAKERVTRGPLFDSASISQIEIPVSTPTADRRVWGVAIWEDVDPRADLISVFVGGLTNAYRWEPPAEGYDPSRPLIEQDRVQAKTLQLNFWRGGDGEELHDNEVIFGIPLYPNDPARQQAVLDAYKLDKPISHRWVFR